MISILFEDSSLCISAIWRGIVTHKLSTLDIPTSGYHLYYTTTMSHRTTFQSSTATDSSYRQQLSACLHPAADLSVNTVTSPPAIINCRSSYLASSIQSHSVTYKCGKKCSAMGSEIVLVLRIQSECAIFSAP